MDSALNNKRLGIKIPRSVLLPPYLASNEFWTDFTDSIDAVLGPNVDSKIDIISNIRQMWVQNPTTESSAVAHTLVDNANWSVPERSIVVQQVNLLGMRLQNAGVVSDDAYQTLSRFVGSYWFGKGTKSFIDFINYCLSSALTMSNLWTQDYVNFLPEGDPGIGTPIWSGGTWYPTTHVTLSAANGLGNLDVLTLQSLFYEVANYNLILHNIDAAFNVPITLASGNTDILAIAASIENTIDIANF